MSLDPTPSVAELLRMKQEREAGRAARHDAPESRQAPARPPIGWPVALRLPWSVLVSDNRRYGVIEGRMLATAEYRQAKAKIRALASDAMGAAAPTKAPLRLIARVFVPDNRPHDCGNFRKLVTDALEGVVYVNDRQLHDEQWIRAGVDVDAPRAVITITPLANAMP